MQMRTSEKAEVMKKQIILNNLSSNEASNRC